MHFLLVGFQGTWGHTVCRTIKGHDKLHFLWKHENPPSRGCSCVVYTTDGKGRWRWRGRWNEGGGDFCSPAGWEPWKDLAEMRRCLWLEEGRKVWMLFKQRQRQRWALMTKLWAELCLWHPGRSFSSFMPLFYAISTNPVWSRADLLVWFDFSLDWRPLPLRLWWVWWSVWGQDTRSLDSLRMSLSERGCLCMWVLGDWQSCRRIS